LLRAFPFSQLSKSTTVLRIQPLTLGEPPVFERAYPPPLNVDELVEDFGEYFGDDSGATIETNWDLLQLSESAEWALSPTRVTLQCFGPSFEEGEEEQIRLDFGGDDLFVPGPDDNRQLKPIEQNLRSLIKLSNDLESEVQPQRRHLWSESGSNFADKLRQALQ
jgi:hypothetical protein